MYHQGYVKGLSPFEYRGKSPHFYRQRLMENTKSKTFSTSVEPNYQYLVPSKWHKSGWKYTTLPKTTFYQENPGEFVSNYNLSYQPYKNITRNTRFSHKFTRNSISKPLSNWKISQFRRSF